MVADTAVEGLYFAHYRRRRGEGGRKEGGHSEIVNFCSVQRGDRVGGRH